MTVNLIVEVNCKDVTTGRCCITVKTFAFFYQIIVCRFCEILYDVLTALKYGRGEKARVLGVSLVNP